MAGPKTRIAGQPVVEETPQEVTEPAVTETRTVDERALDAVAEIMANVRDVDKQVILDVFNTLREMGKQIRENGTAAYNEATKAFREQYERDTEEARKAYEAACEPFQKVLDAQCEPFSHLLGNHDKIKAAFNTLKSSTDLFRDDIGTVEPFTNKGRPAGSKNKTSK